MWIIQKPIDGVSHYLNQDHQLVPDRADAWRIESKDLARAEAVNINAHVIPG